MKARDIAAALIALGGITATAASGCGSTEADACAEEVDCEVINDDGTSNGYCWGTCVPTTIDPPRDAPYLVWTGPVENQPSCRDAVDDHSLDLNPGRVAFSEALVPPFSCPDCACSAPACELPAGVTASSLAVCQEGPGGVETPFDAPPGWDGACVSPGTVPAARFSSYTIPPATERGCVPVEEDVQRARRGEPPSDEIKGPQVMVACQVRSREGLCDDSELLCMQDHHRPAKDWRYCSVAVGPVAGACIPEGPRSKRSYTKQLFFYVMGGLDERRCTDCACAQTAPSTCEALLSTYEDTTCGGLVATTMVDGEGACFDPPSAMSLGSLSAEWTVDAPGTCVASGGEIEGQAPTAQVVTVCCLGEDEDEDAW